MNNQINCELPETLLKVIEEAHSELVPEKSEERYSSLNGFREWQNFDFFFCMFWYEM